MPRINLVGTPQSIYPSLGRRSNDNELLFNYVLSSSMCTSKEDRLNEQALWLNDQLAAIEVPHERVRFIMKYAEENSGKVVQTTSFGIQSSLMLDILHKAEGTSKVPLIWVDTGYLPNETYQHAIDMEKRYGLDLRVYQGALSPARMEVMHGKLWEDPSNEAHHLYNQIRKVEPMQRALHDLSATFVLTGLRKSQTKHRKALRYVNVDHGERLKVCPILDWNDEKVAEYFAQEKLAYHPLFHQGYRSVGDAHSSEPYDPSVHKSERDTRFRGRVQECGLHMNISHTLDHRPSLIEEDCSSSDSSVEDVEPSLDGFTIYGRPNCRFCRAAKKLTNGLTKELDPGVSILEIEVGTSISKEQLEITLGRTVRTVPQVLYKGQYIGGYEDLVEWGRTHYKKHSIGFANLLSGIVVE